MTTNFYNVKVINDHVPNYQLYTNVTNSNNLCYPVLQCSTPSLYLSSNPDIYYSQNHSFPQQQPAVPAELALANSARSAIMQMQIQPRARHLNYRNRKQHPSPILKQPEACPELTPTSSSNNIVTDNGAQKKSSRSCKKPRLSSASQFVSYNGLLESFAVKMATSVSGSNNTVVVEQEDEQNLPITTVMDPVSSDDSIPVVHFRLKEKIEQIDKSVQTQPEDDMIGFIRLQSCGNSPKGPKQLRYCCCLCVESYSNAASIYQHNQKVHSMSSSSEADKHQ